MLYRVNKIADIQTDTPAIFSDSPSHSTKQLTKCRLQSRFTRCYKPLSSVMADAGLTGSRDECFQRWSLSGRQLVQVDIDVFDVSTVLNPPY